MTHSIESEVPVLDVHPLHGSFHSWRDFLIQVSIGPL